MQKYTAEVVGTFILVFCGCASVVVNQTTGALTHPGVAIVWGLIVMALVYTFGDVSGCHLNPAVTFSFWAAGRFPVKQIAPYVVSQCLGAVLGALALRFLFPDAKTWGATHPAGDPFQSFILETILTFILMIVILRVSSGAKEKGLMAGIAVGGVVLLEAMFAGPVSGASMNPARSLGPALVGLNLEHLWVYLTAPVIGAMLAVPIYRITHEESMK